MMTMQKILILGKEKKVKRNTRSRKDIVVTNLLRGETKTMRKLEVLTNPINHL